MISLTASSEDLAAATNPVLRPVAEMIVSHLMMAAAQMAERSRQGYMDKAEAAHYLGKETRTVESWMLPVGHPSGRGRGLPHMKLGETVLFRRDRIDAWALAQEVNPPAAMRAFTDAAKLL